LESVPQGVQTPGTNTTNNLNVTKEPVMTADSSLDHHAHVQQSLSGLISKAHQIDKQVQALAEQISTYLVQLNDRFDKERHQSRAFEPVYDRDRFKQFNEDFRSKFNQTLLRLFLATRLFEEKLYYYNCEVALVQH
jgi:hypothetical protein